MPWPVLRRYDADHLRRFALPLGGIGTGTVSLGGRGDLRDWEIMNRPAKGYTPRTRGARANLCPSAIVYVGAADGTSHIRLLEGPLELDEYEGASGAEAPNHGLPRFRQVSCAAAYPLAQVSLADPDVPITVRLEAGNPLVPGDADASGWPVAVLRYVLHNPSTETVRAAVCLNLPNFIGADDDRHEADWGERRWATGACGNRNHFRPPDDASPLAGIFMDSAGVDRRHPAWGTMALVCLPQEQDEISYREAWAERSWGNTLLEYWDDFSANGRLDHHHQPVNAEDPMASLACGTDLAPGTERAFTFLLAWHFPNRQTWSPEPEADGGCGCEGDCSSRPTPNTIGNYYTGRFRDAWDVATRFAAEWPSLEARTLAFLHDFLASDVPEPLREAALCNLSTLRSQTCFRTPDGRLYGWEGCHDHSGCCPGSCTHVWNYEQATAFLFGDLAQTMREVEFAFATRPDGLMSFRVPLPLRVHSPLEKRGMAGVAAADGQLGCLMKLCREWQLSGDDAFLRRLWPMARRALEFCWQPGGWDGDQDGVMEGCQHNTMDVEYYGPNPQMQGWYLGALRACQEMARHLGDAEFAERCARLFQHGRQWMDEHLFNGQYYEHEIRPPEPDTLIADGLQAHMGAKDLRDPELQLGAGCLVDQLVGQYFAHLVGLGYLHDPERVRTTAQSIFRHNFRPSFHDHFNHMRSYVLGEEAAVLMATYPLGRRPESPFPYAFEVMTGFEYTLAANLWQEGLGDEALRVVAAIRDRYDGRKRSPFDEAECGHHYARAMASWGTFLACTGFRFDARTGLFQLRAGLRQCFWSTGYAWGLATQDSAETGTTLRLHVRHGQLRLTHLRLLDGPERELPEPVTLAAGEQAQWLLPTP